MPWQPRVLARTEVAQEAPSERRGGEEWEEPEGLGVWRRNQDVKCVCVKQNLQARAQETVSAGRMGGRTAGRGSWRARLGQGREV